MKMHTLCAGAVIGLSLGLGFPAFAATPMDIHEKDTKEGKVLTDRSGHTLYVFAGDQAGQSNCSGECAKNWPPALVSKDAKSLGEFTLVRRADGQLQWAYKGMPLYRFAQDKKAGDATGEGGMSGKWHMAKE